MSTTRFNAFLICTYIASIMYVVCVWISDREFHFNFAACIDCCRLFEERQSYCRSKWNIRKENDFVQWKFKGKIYKKNRQQSTLVWWWDEFYLSIISWLNWNLFSFKWSDCFFIIIRLVNTIMIGSIRFSLKLLRNPFFFESKS